MTDLEKRFIKARRDAIAVDYQNLNDCQRQGVLATEGPLLLLAGAGSGKTTVLIHRVANLLRYGRGSDTEEIPIPIGEDEVSFLEQYAKVPDSAQHALVEYLCAVEPARPWEVLAITFTNKAANELKDRLGRMLGEEAAADVWASTFHSACVRILRRDIVWPDDMDPDARDLIERLRAAGVNLHSLAIIESAEPGKIVFREEA